MTRIIKNNSDKRHNPKTKSINVLRDTTNLHNNLQIAHESKMPRKITRNKPKADVNTFSVAARKTRRKNFQEPEALTAVDEKLKSPCTVRIPRLRANGSNLKLIDEKLKSPCTVRVARIRSHVKDTKSKTKILHLEKDKILPTKQTRNNKKKTTNSSATSIDSENVILKSSGSIDLNDEKLNSPCVVHVTRMSKKNINIKKNLRTNTEVVEHKNVYDKENILETSGILLSPKTSNKNVSLRRTKLFENKNEQFTHKRDIEKSTFRNSNLDSEGNKSQ